MILWIEIGLQVRLECDEFGLVDMEIGIECWMDDPEVEWRRSIVV